MVTKAKRRRKAAARKYARIYYNEPGRPELYWRVRVRDATKSVKVNGSLADAIQGAPGSTVGCAISNCIVRNRGNLPHPALLVSVTKTAVLIVDQFKNGQPHSAVRYVHRSGNIVDLNDTDKSKTMVKQNPKLIERSLTLYAPYKTSHKPGGHPHTGASGVHTESKKSEVLRGALARAVKAGLISKPIAKALDA